ncbi:uncharacterized protein [Palaemon carinicauda]|uniref:uncharacterized protein n=1 Tax=Palaemon carinicauda TaxID=392227 RepID=UPI0035B6790D
METATSGSCTSALLSGWIARFGIPEHITSDMGTTLTSQLWSLLRNLLGITLHQTSTYNPAANRIVERFHCTLRVAFMSRCKNSGWVTKLPWVLLWLRTTPKDALDISAAEMVYGDPLVVPAEFFPSATSSDNLQCLYYIVEVTLCCQSYKPPAMQHIPSYLNSATDVFLHNNTNKPPLMPLHGPFPCDPLQSEGFLNQHSRQRRLCLH